MKNLILLFLGLLLATIGQAQIATKTVNLTSAGTLSTVLTANELGSTVGLTLTGTIDARDFKTMRDSMPYLAEIDLSGVSIVAYTGGEGTGNGIILYKANTIPESALSEKTSLTTFAFPNNTTEISSNAFLSCSGLLTVELPSGLTKIGHQAFGWSGLNNITLHDSIRYIGNGAFATTDIATITIPANVEFIGATPFYQCRNLSEIQVDGANKYYCSAEGVLFNKSRTELMQYPNGKADTVYYVPTGVEKIQAQSFDGGNSSLKRLYLPEGVKEIGRWAFVNVWNLQEVDLPGSLLTIGSGVFYGNTTLNKVTNHCTVPVTIDSDVFNNVNKSTCTLYVPYGSKAAYQNAVQWKDFQNIVEMQGLFPSATSLSFTPSAATTKIFIGSSVGWSAESSANWLSIDPASSQGSDSLSITVTQNANDVRTATITIHPTGLPDQTITIIQYGVVQVTAGSLAAVLGNQLETTTSLTLVGTIDARDFKTMRDSMPSLAEIDLSGVTIVEYIGSVGTINGTGNYNYPANEVPQHAFLNSNWQGKTTLVSVVFPTTITSIGSYAFNNCNKLTSVNIPNGVTYISNYAFNNCNNLESVSLPNTLTEISYNAFSYCTKLKDINIPASVTVIGESTFRNCAGPFIVNAGNPNYSSLNGVLFDKNKITLLQCPNTQTGVYTVPSSVKTIGNAAFENCNNLTIVDMFEGITTIGNYAFNNCINLILVYIPASVTLIRESAFRNCAGPFIVDASNPNYSSLNGVLFDKNQTTLIQCPTSLVGEYTVPSSVKTIGNYASIYCINLTTVNIPEGVTTIGNYAFYNCSNLTSVSIPSTVSNIGSYAFAYSNSMASIYANSSTPVDLSNMYGVFEGINKNTCTLYVPYGSKSAYQNAVKWKDFTNIIEIFDAEVQVTAGNLATVLGNQLESITSLTLSGTIDARDFKTMRDSMPLLAEIDLSGVSIVAYNGAEGTINGTGNYSYPANVVPEQAFRNSNYAGKATLVSVVFPTTVTSIGSYAFYNCNNLANVILPSSLRSINSDAFFNCDKLTSVNIPNGVTYISNYAFNNCNNLESVSLPNTLIEISYGAFSYCTKLKDINIPASVTLIRERAFINCAGPFIVDASNPNYSSLNGVLFDKNKITLIQCPNTQTGVYAVPPSVKTIGNYAFSNCYNLSSVIIPEGVTTIGNSAFNSCINLASVNIPASVAVIGESAFLNCAGPFIVNSSNPNYSSLNGVLFDKNKITLLQCPASLNGAYTVPSSVKTIGYSAFSNCDNLTTVNITEGVTTIGNYAFYSCSKLTSVSIPSTVSNIGNYAFAYTDSMASITANSSAPVELSNSNWVFDGINKTTCTLYVPYGSKSAYQNAVQWKDFTTIVEATSGFGVGVKTILLPSIENDSTLSVIANVPWSVSTDQAWLSVSPQSGANNGSFTISAPANTGPKRKATVTLSSSGYSDQLIFVSQESGLPNLILSDSMNASAPLVCDNYIKIITNSNHQFFRFLPEQSGNYTFYSESTSDPIAAVINSMGNNIGGDDDSGPDMNFIFTCNLIAGEEYYFRLRNYSGNNQAIDLNITGGNLVCNQNGIPEDQQISSRTLRENTDTCFNAYENITVAGNETTVVFESSSSTTLIAGKSIRFLPGFHAQSGSWMDAHITTTNLFCNAANESMLAAQVEEKSIEVTETEAVVVIPGEKSIKVYPNPNNGQFFLEVSNFETRATVSIYNMLGSKVYESELTNEINHKINLLGIKKGIYFVKVTDWKEQFTKKIIVR